MFWAFVIKPEKTSSNVNKQGIIAEIENTNNLYSFVTFQESLKDQSASVAIAGKTNDKRLKIYNENMVVNGMMIILGRTGIADNSLIGRVKKDMPTACITKLNSRYVGL